MLTVISGYIVNIENTDEEYHIFKGISDSRIANKNIERLTGLKKSPIYQFSENEFITLDKSFLLGKIYNQFIFDFWFDWIKKKTEIPIETYFGDIGHFFEIYASDILKSLFSFLEHPIPLSLRELEYNSNSGTKEICDFYARHNRKIFIGEIKLGHINDTSRFSGKTETLYMKKSRDDFFKSADQLNHAIKNLSIIQDKFDEKIPLNKPIQIFPVCIFNDSIYSLPTMAVIFDKYWNKIKYHCEYIHVNPLTIIHIDQLELINSFFNTKNKKKQIWDILKTHTKSAGRMRSFGVSLIQGFKLEYDISTIEQLQLIIDE